MRQPLLPLGYPKATPTSAGRGAIFTKPWVVDLVLDLAGYTPDANLVDAVAIEPAAGEGAFLVAMARRLIGSCRRRGRPVLDGLPSLIAFEIDERSARVARRAVVDALAELEVDGTAARGLAEAWVRTGDFLLDGPKLPRADFVVGNPPYVRLEDIPGETADLYRASYSTMRGRADLYVAFFEAALERLQEGGVCAFICADRWMLNQYGAGLRRLITSRFDVRTIVEMHDADAFDEGVSAYPAITAIRRGAQGPVVVARAGPSTGPVDAREVARSLQIVDGRLPMPRPPAVASAVVEGWFEGADPWPCGSPERLALLRRLEGRFPALEDGAHTRVGIGVATGCDGVFITEDRDLVEPDRLLPLAMAADTLTGRLEWSGHYLVDPWKGDGLVRLADHPRLRAYFEAHRAALAGRHTAKKNPTGWYKTIDRVSHALKDRAKLYIPDIKDEFHPVLDRGATYPHHNLYYIISEIWDLEVLGGLLLSAVAQLFIEAYGVRMRGGYLRFQAQYLRRIRVPTPASIGPGPARELAESFRARDRGRATREALRLYGLEPGAMEAAGGR